MQLKTFIYDAFTETAFGGNVAGVVIIPAGVETSLLQKIAAEINAPTTGFVELLGTTTYRTRFFSATSEMDMCGHVTIGVACALVENGFVEYGPLLQQTLAGPVQVAVTQSKRQITVAMQQRLPAYTEFPIDPSQLYKLLGVEDQALDPRFRFGCASTGLMHLFVAVKAEALPQLQPNNPELYTFSKEHKLDTIGVFSVAGKQGDSSVSAELRDLCHGVGNPEESASGTTNGALASFLFHRGWFGSQAPQVTLNTVQGRQMGRPSSIQTTLSITNGVVSKVLVGGSAKRILEGMLYLPE